MNWWFPEAGPGDGVVNSSEYPVPTGFEWLTYEVSQKWAIEDDDWRFAHDLLDNDMRERERRAREQASKMRALERAAKRARSPTPE